MTNGQDKNQCKNVQNKTHLDQLTCFLLSGRKLKNLEDNYGDTGRGHTETVT